jgi:hypothetical protein
VMWEDEVRTPRVPSQPATGRGRRRFLRRYLEMAGALLAPAVAVIPLLRLGLLAGDALLMLEHLAMFPLMFLVMLRRRSEYGGSAHG